MMTAVGIYIIVSFIVSVLVAVFLKGAALDGSLEGNKQPARKSPLRRRGFVMATAGPSGRGSRCCCQGGYSVCWQG
jgi:hypothetical protein